MLRPDDRCDVPLRVAGSITCNRAAEGRSFYAIFMKFVFNAHSFRGQFKSGNVQLQTCAVLFQTCVDVRHSSCIALFVVRHIGSGIVDGHVHDGLGRCRAGDDLDRRFSGGNVLLEQY